MIGNYEDNGLKPDSLFRKVVVVLVAFALLPTVALALIQVYFKGLDTTPPQLRIEGLAAGLSKSEAEVSCVANDSHSGLANMRFFLRQGDRLQPLGEEVLQRQAQHSISAKISATNTGLVEGDVEFICEAFDASWRKNTARINQHILIDYEPPSIKVVSAPKSAKVGQVALVVYKASDYNLEKHGIEINGNLFVGLPTSMLSLDLSIDGLYFVFVPASNELKSVHLIARDRAGNVKDLPIEIAIEDIKGKELTQVVDERLSLEAERLFEINKGVLVPHGQAAQDSESNSWERFQLVNNKLRQIDDQAIAFAVKSQEQQGNIDNIDFTRKGGVAASGFADSIKYEKDSSNAVTWFPRGQLIDQPNNNEMILATASGTIVYADNIGTYGATAIIDHGMGVASVYSGLGELLVSVGHSIKKGQPIGKTGPSGLLRGQSYLFQVRINGIPVDPGTFSLEGSIVPALQEIVQKVRVGS